MNTVTRRHFLKSTLTSTAALALTSPGSVLGANEKIVVGFMGLGGRGTGLLQKFLERNDIEVAYLCDPNRRRAAAAQILVAKASKDQPAVVQDFRKILDDRRVNVVVNSTPDHWHGLGTILACQAGKDVYVEKPLSHNIFEGQKMVEAARKYQRIVQVGMQTRSAPYAQAAAEFVRSGRLGEVRLVRVFNIMQHSRETAGSVQPVPPELDYDLWSGPAPLLPYNPRRSWLNRWEYSCGPIFGDAIHQLDLARMVLGDIPFPGLMTQQAAVLDLRDGRETPDSQHAIFEYPGFHLVFESALWAPYLKKVPMPLRDLDTFPNWPFYSMRIEILGSRNMMYLGRHGGGWQVFDANAKVIDEMPGRQGDAAHIANFLDCARSRQRPNADVEQGHYSVLLCHLANISYRIGNKPLRWDAVSARFPKAPEAEAYLKRSYRAPWVVPDPV